jgi:uncharacterized protein (TIGR02246 family)
MRFATSAGIGLVLLAGFVAAQTPPASAPAVRPAAAAPTAAPAQAPKVQSSVPGEATIKERLAGFVKAYNARNAASLSDFFTDEATLIDVDGTSTQGKAAISAQFAAGFAQATSYTLEAEIDLMRNITTDVVVVEGLSKLTAPNETPIANRFVTLVAKQGEVWKIAEIRDLPAPPEQVSPADRLAEFDWMVGEWVDQNGDVKIHSSIKWGENKAYLTRTTAVHVGDEKESSSLMILAWDPQSSQVRSWLFDSNGGRGEGTWTRASDNQWIIRAQGTLLDGTPTSATQTVTLVGKDAVKTSSIDRIIGGEVAPDIDEILMVRKPPTAGGAAAAPAPATPVAPVR